jgi:ATP-dependent Clp protease adaptor protein ClpS
MTTTENVIEKKRVTSKEIKEPKKYKVLVLNDDMTPIDFVVAMLITVFRHNDSSALKLTLDIHNNGSAVAGIYSHEVAEQKILDGTTMARANGFPLMLKAEAA